MGEKDKSVKQLENETEKARTALGKAKRKYVTAIQALQAALKTQRSKDHGSGS